MFVLSCNRLNELAVTLKFEEIPEHFLLSIALYIARLEAHIRSEFRDHCTLDDILEAKLLREARLPNSFGFMRPDSMDTTNVM